MTTQGYHCEMSKNISVRSRTVVKHNSLQRHMFLGKCRFTSISEVNFLPINHKLNNSQIRK